jgi:hypothetical protein
LERLLKVVAENLLDFVQATACGPLDQGREPLVEVRSQLFRDRAVRGVANEDVPEPITVFAGSDCRLRTNELLLTRRARRSGTVSRKSAGTSSVTALRQKRVPMTAARSITASPS